MSDYWCAKCNDTTITLFSKSGPFCALCREPCEKTSTVIHALQEEIGRFIIANAAEELTEVQAECDRLKGVIEQFNEDRFSCNCNNAPKSTKCFPWCRSNDGIKV